MTLNNKGFAITGILYTLFILFLLLLVSVLAALSSRKRMNEASTRLLEDSYAGEVINIDDMGSVSTVLGRYKFKFSADSDDNVYYCYAYLRRGVSLDNISGITFTNSDCNLYKDKYNSELVEVVSFEKE